MNKIYCIKGKNCFDKNFLILSYQNNAYFIHEIALPLPLFLSPPPPLTFPPFLSL